MFWLEILEQMTWNLQVIDLQDHFLGEMGDWMVPVLLEPPTILNGRCFLLCGSINNIWSSVVSPTVPAT